MSWRTQVDSLSIPTEVCILIFSNWRTIFRIGAEELCHAVPEVLTVEV